MRLQFARFLAGGAANTVVTYGLYLALLGVLGYQLAYGVAYAAGVALSYWVNVRFVFRQRGSWRKVAQFPIVYGVQYVAAAAVLWVAVDVARIPPAAGPAVAIAVTVPLTFVLSRWILVGRGEQALGEKAGSKG